MQQPIEEPETKMMSSMKNAAMTTTNSTTTSAAAAAIQEKPSLWLDDIGMPFHTKKIMTDDMMTLLALSPFDVSDRNIKMESALMCSAPLGSLNAVQDEQELVRCSKCPMGFEIDSKTNLLKCRMMPLCSTDKCKQCLLSTHHPFHSGPCSMCVRHKCDPNANRCACE